MESFVVLARLGSAEVSALVAGIIFMAIMGYLLFSGEKHQEQPKPPTKPRPRR